MYKAAKTLRAILAAKMMKP